jgi:hypothetical protein
MDDQSDFPMEYVTDVKGIFYEEEDSPEALEFIFTSGMSIVLTSATDWTLSIKPGNWPDLPSWCYPKSSWSSRSMHGALGRCTEFIAESGTDGKLMGATLTFAESTISVSSGDQLRVVFSAN